MKFWAPILATSKAQQLLFRIVDCLLLPHSVLQQDKELPVALMAAIQESLPLYLQVISAHWDQQQTYLQEQSCCRGFFLGKRVIL